MKQSNEPEIQRKIKALFILFEAKTKTKSKTKNRSQASYNLLGGRECLVADRCRNVTTVVKLFNCNNKIIIQFFKEVPSSTVPHSDLATSSILTAVHGPHPTCLNPGGGTVFNSVDGDLFTCTSRSIADHFSTNCF